MAYDGYRVKIAGTVISNNMIVPGSYKFQRSQRVLASYYDATGTLHEELSPKKTVMIQFSIIDRTVAEHAQIMAAFANRSNVQVEYWDDEECTYVTGTFKIEDLDIAHLNSRFGTIRYAQMPVSLKEY